MLNALNHIDAQNTALEARFRPKLKVNPRLSRQLVSFQANKDIPGYRWYRYKEGFSEALIQYILDTLHLDSGTLLDPFAGTGTTLFASAHQGLHATGIELLPIGSEVIAVRELASKTPLEGLIVSLRRWRDDKPWLLTDALTPFPHLNITKNAFSPKTETELSQYLTTAQTQSSDIARLLRFAALCVLEDISYTRKDGQYLRWDYRSGRRQGTTPFDKGRVYSFQDAITQKLDEIITDLSPTRFLPGLFDAPVESGEIKLLRGSCLEILPTLATASFDGLITSPPYANRYDYTRTYALELALLGVGEEEIRALRQTMVSCTVENKEKEGLERHFSPMIYQKAQAAFEGQAELHGILGYLEAQKAAKTLNNPGIPRMVRNYFFELALVIFDCARLLKPGAPFVMVNDNVRYGGANIPVDLILSDIAEQAVLEVEVIWVLPTGKGNSSQQMGAHGREELRKCVYVWRRKE